MGEVGRRGRSLKVTNGRRWEKGEEFESDQWENEGEGGGVRVRKEVDRKRDEKKHTRRNNNLKKNHL